MNQKITLSPLVSTILIILSVFFLLFISIVSSYYLIANNYKIENIEENATKDTFPNTISITGNSTVYENPDMAIVQLNIETKNENLGDAQKINAEKIKVVSEAVKSLGVPAGSLKTSNFYVYPSYPYQDYYDPSVPKEMTEIEYYQVSHNLTINIDDLALTEDIVNTAIENEASINSVQFTLKDFAKTREKAYQEAAKITKERAQYIAEAMGVNLGNLYSINAYNYDNSWNWYGSSATNQAVDYAPDGSIYTGELLNAGKVEVKVEISATYKIEN